MLTFKHVIIEGIPGVGKTEFSAELADALERLPVPGTYKGPMPQSLYLTEPDEANGGNPYLQDYYTAQARWAAIMQFHLLTQRMLMHLNAIYHVKSKRGDAILDRSFYGDVAFAEVQNQLDYLPDREYESYKELYELMTAFVSYPNVCVHLVISPEVSLQRIQRRMGAQKTRSCELEIDLDYLARIHNAIMRMTEVLQHFGTFVLRVPWDEDRPSKSARAEEILRVAELIRAHVPKREFADIYKRIV